MRIVVRLLACVFAASVAIAALAAPVHAQTQETFTITGEVSGLFPGATVTLVAKVTNPHSFAVRVTSVGATPVSGGACPTSMLVVIGSTAEVTIPPGTTGDIPLSIHMDTAAADVCQGATFTLAFSGSAVEASPSSLATSGITIGGLILAGGTLIAIGLTVRRRVRRGANA